jgi:hypothetical protein
MQLSDFKVGDRVKMSQDSNVYWGGVVGTVTKVKSPFVFFSPDIVEDENSIYRRHLKNYRNNFNKGAGFYPEDFEILNEKNEKDESVMSIETIRIIDKWIQNDEQFTCFDVTRQLRADGYDVKHTETRDLVHGLYDSDLPPFRGSNYKRSTKTFTTVLGVQDTAEVYHEASDYDDYNPDALDPTVVIAAVVKTSVDKSDSTQVLCKWCNVAHPHLQPKAMSPMDIPVVPKKDTNVSNTATTSKYHVDSRGRICVRNELVKALDVKAGERVFLRKSPANNEFILSSHGGGDVFGSLRVDKDQNIRISRYLQKKAGLNASQFSMWQSGNKVIVSL